MTISLNNFPAHRPYSNVQPFTVRDGATYLLQVEGLAAWMRDYVIPHLNSEAAGLSENWKAQTLALMEDWTAKSLALEEAVNIAVGSVQDNADAVIAAQVLAEAARDMAEQFASGAVAMQDASVSAIFSDAESTFRGLVNGTFITQTQFAEAEEAREELSDVIENGRLSPEGVATLIDNVTGTVNAKRLGLVGDGVTNDAPALQEAIDLLTSLAVSGNSYERGYSLLIEGGRYRIDEQIKLSPAVKLVSHNGTVIFDCYAEFGSQFHFSSEGLPQVGTSSLKKQQYFRGAFIDGSSGGFVFSYKGTGLEVTCLEIGDRTDLNPYRPISRYNSSDYAIEGFDTAIKFNRFNNYIGTFDRVMLETNRRCVVFGDDGATQLAMNSGENITWNSCLFASGQVGFEWNLDGFDNRFFGCSFDYLRKVFVTHRSFKNISVFGGHIESFDMVIAEDDSAGAFETEIPILISGTSIYTGRGSKFKSVKGLISVDLDNVDYRIRPQESRLAETYFMADSNINIRRALLKFTSVDQFPGLKANLFTNADFSKDALGPVANPATTPPVGYEAVGREFISTYEIVENPSPVNGWAQALKMQASAVTGWVQFTTKPFPVEPGQKIMAAMAFRYHDVQNLTRSIRIRFYDVNDTLLGTVDTGNIIDNSALDSSWQYPQSVPDAFAPAGTAKARVLFNFSRFNTAPLYVTGAAIFKV